jgi:hypothetical protein
MSVRQWEVRQCHWIPLRRATFAFCISKDGRCSPLGGRALDELCQSLAASSGADKTEVDPIGCRFSFTLIDSGGGELILKGAPWAILRDGTDNPVWFEVQTISTPGSWTDVEDKVRRDRLEENAQAATMVIWRQRMLPALDHAISVGAVALYARPETINTCFEQLPSGLWPLLKVIDWVNGVAVTADGRIYRSIHFELRSAKISSAALEPSKTAANAVHMRRRGPRPLKRSKVEEEMRRDIQDGRITLSELEAMLEKSLAASYGACRDTIRKARNNVLLRFKFSNSDK